MYASIDHIYLGPDLHMHFQSPESRMQADMIRDIKYSCCKFLVTLCCQIKDRFCTENKLWYFASYLKPHKLLSAQSRLTLPTLVDFCSEVPCIDADIQALDDEWCSKDWVTMQDDIRDHVKGDVTEFYKKLLEYEDIFGTKTF